MRSPILFGAMSKEINTFVSENIGDVAQLARALDWQSRGRRFESALLHSKTEGFTDGEPFFLQLSLL